MPWGEELCSNSYSCPGSWYPELPLAPLPHPSPLRPALPRLQRERLLLTWILRCWCTCEVSSGLTWAEGIKGCLLGCLEIYSRSLWACQWPAMPCYTAFSLVTRCCQPAGDELQGEFCFPLKRHLSRVITEGVEAPKSQRMGQARQGILNAPSGLFGLLLWTEWSMWTPAVPRATYPRWSGLCSLQLIWCQEGLALALGGDVGSEWCSGCRVLFGST